jgi:hypothetical protein
MGTTLPRSGTARRLVVVDWKTDRARSDAEVDAALDRYRHQGAAYAVALEQATNRPVDEVVFVFCRPGPAVERAVTGEDLDLARQAVLAALAS